MMNGRQRKELGRMLGQARTIGKTSWDLLVQFRRKKLFPLCDRDLEMEPGQLHPHMRARIEMYAEANDLEVVAHQEERSEKLMLVHFIRRKVFANVAAPGPDEAKAKMSSTIVRYMIYNDFESLEVVDSQRSKAKESQTNGSIG